jgi:UbiD family decarboxylase
MDMEEFTESHLKPEAAREPRTPVAWRDLREWLALVEDQNLLKHIAATVDPDEELGAITFLASRQAQSPALLFESLLGDASASRILTNMLGASKERYALAVGINPNLSTLEMISATRSLMVRSIEPVRISKQAAPVNEVVITGDDIDLTRFPVPKFWPGDGGVPETSR